MSKRKLMTAATTLASAAILAACSSGGGLFGTGGDDGPSAPQSYDLNPTELTSEGCLQLPMVFNKLRSLPSDAVIRRLSPDFDIQPKDQSNNGLRRNFVAIAAFSNFAYEEKGAALYGTDFPNVTQSACDSVQFTSDLEGTMEMKIVASDSEQILKLEREDGAELVYELKGPRELEVRSSGEAMDPCPDYIHAKVTNVKTYVWGTESDLAQVPLRISRSFLQKISVGLQDMPEELATLAVMDESDYVTTNARDLRSMTASTMDTKILECPYKADPPDGTEPPPPPPDPSPAPTPIPIPTPVDEPAPVPTPEPPPIFLPSL